MRYELSDHSLVFRLSLFDHDAISIVTGSFQSDRILP
jgi:hypothetical protein